MTDTTSVPAAPPTDPGPPPPRPSSLPTGSERFFSWVRGLGVARGDAWLGGVCGGLAARLRIDPIIVRGIFVVVALVGFPALLVYAIAWALLPDVDGRIHLRELVQGRFDPAMVGILIMTAVSFVPVVPWLWNAALWPVWTIFGGPVWDMASPFGGVGVILALALIGTATFFILRSARADRNAGDQQTTAASASAAPATAAASVSGDDAASAFAAAPALGDADPAGRAPAGSAGGSASPVEGTDAADSAAAAAPGAGDPGAEDPGAGALGGAALGAAALAGAAPAVGAPAAGASAEAAAGDVEVAQWRASHEAWRAQNDAYRRSQQDAERSAREQARQERQAAGASFAAEAEERRRVRRATRPRTSFVFVTTALGAAGVAGALAALTALGDPALAGFSAAIGLLAAGIVMSLTMVVAGVARRRSGFLTAVAIVLVAAGILAAIAAGPRSFVLGNVALGTSTVPTTIVQPFGSTDLTVLPLSEDENVDAGTISIRKSSGVTYITVNPGTAVEIQARLGTGDVEVQRFDPRSNDVEEVPVDLRPGEDGTREWTWFTRNTSGSGDPVTRQKIVLEQGIGPVYVTVYEPEEDR